MNQTASTSALAERLATEESERHSLLYSDRQLLKTKQFRELILGLHRRSTIAMVLMGVMLLYQGVMAIIHSSMIAESSLSEWLHGMVTWGRPLMCAAFAAMFVVALRDVLRSRRVLREMAMSN